LEKSIRISGWIFFFWLLLPWGGKIFYILGIRWLYVFILGFLATYLCVPIAEALAHKFGILDFPEKRKIHNSPVPRLGGPALFYGFLVAVLRNLRFSRELVGILIGAFLVFSSGLIDDVRRGVSASFRLFLHDI